MMTGALALSAPDPASASLVGTVCPGCCRVRPDCEPVEILRTLFRQVIEQRCGECRAAGRFIPVGGIHAGRDIP